MGSVLPGYRWRKPVAVNYTADGAQTNYQCKLTVVQGSGVEAAGTTYLGNLALNWPYDIAFTLPDGITPVSCWREEYDATDGSWWIKYPSIPAAAPAWLWMYYAAPGGVDLSNGANTFEFYDNFNNLNNYTLGGTVTAAGNVMTVGGTGWATCNTTFPVNRAIRAMNQCAHFNGASNTETFGWGDTAMVNDAIAQYAHSAAENRGKWINYLGGGSTKTGAITGVTSNVYHTIDLIRNGATNTVFKINDANIVTYTTNLPTGSISFFWGNWTVGDQQKCSWVLVRTCTLNEPTWQVAGRAEACGNRMFGFRREDTQRIKFHRKFNLK